jgi:hypothetical protein
MDLGDLPAGRRFRTRFGVEGVVVRRGRGSVCVRVKRPARTVTFTPEVGRDAGRTVTIRRDSEVTHWGLTTQVDPLA